MYYYRMTTIQPNENETNENVNTLPMGKVWETLTTAIEAAQTVQLNVNAMFSSGTVKA